MQIAALLQFSNITREQELFPSFAIPLSSKLSRSLNLSFPLFSRSARSLDPNPKTTDYPNFRPKFVKRLELHYQSEVHHQDTPQMIVYVLSIIVSVTYNL